MKILILQNRATGHSLVWVGELIDSLTELGHAPMLAISESGKNSDEYVLHIGRRAPDTVVFKEPISNALIREIANQHSPDLIVIPDGDEWMRTLATAIRPFNTRINILISSDPRWETSPSPTRRIVLQTKSLLLRRLRRHRDINVIWLREFGFRGNSRIQYAVDPYIANGSLSEIASRSVSIRKEIGLDSSYFWFSVVGVISARKNVDLVAEALSTLGRRVPNIKLGLALVGPQDETLLQQVQSILEKNASYNIVVCSHNKVLSNFELNAAILASDAVVMAYSSEAPNSTMVKCLALGTRIVVAGSATIQGFARGMGLEPVDLCREELACAMEIAISQPAPVPRVDTPTSTEFSHSLITFSKNT